MKLTTQKLKQLIREELAKMGEVMGSSDKMRPLQGSDKLKNYKFRYKKQDYIIRVVKEKFGNFDYDVFIDGGERLGPVYLFRSSEEEMNNIIEDKITRGIDKHLAKGQKKLPLQENEREVI